MRTKGSLEQICFSVFSNIVVLGLSLVSGFFLPKFVSVETYADYKTYTLYASYLGLFHMGFINGVYLKYGGYDFSDLPKDIFRSYTRFLLLLQLFVQIVLFICLMPYHLNMGSFISPYGFIVFNILFINVVCYFNLVNQFTRKFVIDGIIQLIQKMIVVVGIVMLLVLKIDNYVPYLIVTTFSNVFTLIVLMVYDRKLVWGPSVGLVFSDIKTLISRGFFIMISEYMGLIIVGIDSIIINLFYSRSHFSIYAFAVSIIVVLYQLTSVISKPVFPYLKRQEVDSVINYYDRIKIGFVLFSSLIMGLTIVMSWVINTFIPKYEESISIIQILALTVSIKGVHDLLFGNYFKVLSLEKLFVKTNIIAFVLGVLTDMIAFLVFRSMIAIAIASVISFSIWYIVTDAMLQRSMKSHSYKGNLLLLVMGLLVYISMLFGPFWGALVYYSVVVLFGIMYLSRTKLFRI